MPDSFGELLREHRLSAGFGLRRFAVMVGLQPSNLSDIEHGRRGAPESPDKLNELADALGLLEGSEDRRRFFDVARAPGHLPADVRHMADRRLVPALLRTIDNKQLDDEAISRLIEDITQDAERSAHA